MAVYAHAVAADSPRNKTGTRKYWKRTKNAIVTTMVGNAAATCSDSTCSNKAQPRQQQCEV